MEPLNSTKLEKNQKSNVFWWLKTLIWLLRAILKIRSQTAIVLKIQQNSTEANHSTNESHFMEIVTTIVKNADNSSLKNCPTNFSNKHQKSYGGDVAGINCFWGLHFEMFGFENARGPTLLGVSEQVINCKVAGSRDEVGMSESGAIYSETG